MKPNLAAGMAILATVIAAPSAKALTVTTSYNQFTWTQGAIPTRNPSPLTFQTFNSLLLPPGATLNSVKYKLSSVQNPSPVNSLDPIGASVGGKIRANNSDSETDSFVSGATYDLKLQFSTGQLLKPSATTTSISCAISSPGVCSQTGSGVTIGAGLSSTNTEFVLNGKYAGLSNPLTGTALSPFLTGSTVSTVNGSINNYLVAFAGQSTNNDTTFNYNSGLISPKAFMTGYIALEYDYSLPPVPGATVPGPLPLLGAASAFAWSRRMRKRITSAV